MTSEALSTQSYPEQSPQAIAAQSQSNFVLSFLFLSKERREGITRFYALSRVIDDAVDDHPPEEAAKLLEFWKKEVSLCYGGKPAHSVTRAMQSTIERFHIPKSYLDLLLEGCEWDLSRHRYETLDALLEYCHRVAVSIGLTCMKIFGVEGAKADQMATELGLALQLTNIVRDVRVDSALGRIYLPQALLKKHGVSEDDVLAAVATPALEAVCVELLQAAEGHFNAAFSLLAELPRRPLLPAWIMGKFYFGIFQRIQQDPSRIFREKVSLSKLSKLWILMKECGKVMGG